MGRKRPLAPVTQVHLEKAPYRDKWYLTISDGFAFFRAKRVTRYMLTRRAVEKLYCLIDRELNESAE